MSSAAIQRGKRYCRDILLNSLPQISFHGNLAARAQIKVLSSSLSIRATHSNEASQQAISNFDGCQRRGSLSICRSSRIVRNSSGQMHNGWYGPTRGMEYETLTAILKTSATSSLLHFMSHLPEDAGGQLFDLFLHGDARRCSPRGEPVQIVEHRAKPCNDICRGAAVVVLGFYQP